MCIAHRPTGVRQGLAGHMLAGDGDLHRHRRSSRQIQKVLELDVLLAVPLSVELDRIVRLPVHHRGECRSSRRPERLATSQSRPGATGDARRTPPSERSSGVCRRCCRRCSNSRTRGARSPADRRFSIFIWVKPGSPSRRTRTPPLASPSQAPCVPMSRKRSAVPNTSSIRGRERP